MVSDAQPALHVLHKTLTSEADPGAAEGACV